MRRYQAQLASDCRCQLGEGPTWDPHTGKVYWLDVTGKELHSLSLASGQHEYRSLPHRLGCIVMREDTGAVAAGEKGFVYCDPDTGNISPIIDPESTVSGTTFNDGKCDPRGRLFAGTASENNRPEGAFYCLHPDGTVNRLFGGVGCSNGIAWSLDHQTMYYIDSLAYTVEAFDYDLETGSIHNKRTVISNSNPNILLDGMTWDEDGMLWIAEWGGWNVSRWNPHTGEKLTLIEVPAKYVTSCVFGGDERNELFITTAIHSLTVEEMKEQPHAGGLFRVKLEVTGAPSFQFKG